MAFALVLFPVAPPSVVMVSVVVMAVVGTMLSFAVAFVGVVAELELSGTADVVVVVVVVVVEVVIVVVGIVPDEDSGVALPDALSGTFFFAGLNSMVAWFM